jgi:Lar family restriction alleviation protein
MKEIVQTQIDACPFCRKHSDYVYADVVENIYYVECVHCGAKGPVSRTRSEAVERWNNGSHDP